MAIRGASEQYSFNSRLSTLLPLQSEHMTIKMSFVVIFQFGDSNK